MLKLFIPLFVLLLSACHGGEHSQSSVVVNKGANQGPDSLQALAWVGEADVKRAIEQALAKQDYRIFVLAGRGEAAPGIDPNQKYALEKQCGKQYLPGSSDVIRGAEHQRLLQAAHEYAAVYNQEIIKHCSGQ